MDFREEDARRAYEWGRARMALRVTPWVAALTLAACAFAWRGPITLVLGCVLWCWCVFLLWRGETAGRAVMSGLLYGVAPCVVPMLALAERECPPSWSAPLCLFFCVGGGVISGALLSWRAARQAQAWQWWMAACSVAVLTGTMGCAWAGLSGVVGMLAGLAVGTVPVALSPSWHRR